MHKPAVNVMIKAARAGGNILLRHLARLEAIEVVEKDRMDYASEIDTLAEVAIDYRRRELQLLTRGS